jgi:hypothetical protein
MVASLGGRCHHMRPRPRKRRGSERASRSVPCGVVSDCTAPTRLAEGFAASARHRRHLLAVAERGDEHEAADDLGVPRREGERHGGAEIVRDQVDGRSPRAGQGHQSSAAAVSV